MLRDDQEALGSYGVGAGSEIIVVVSRSKTAAPIPAAAPGSLELDQETRDSRSHHNPLYSPRFPCPRDPPPGGGAAAVAGM